MREAVIAAAGMCLFALFAKFPLPLFLVSLVGLLVVATVIARSIQNATSWRAVLGWPPFTRRVWLTIPFGCIIGLFLAASYRITYALPLPPGPLQGFVVPAALIGAVEESVYRGYIQGKIGKSGFLFAPAFAALSHTAYKSALFLFPLNGSEIQFGMLVALTFVFGFLLGLLRQISGSVLPALAAHVLFDVLAYGDWPQAPWWVWG